MAKMFSHKQVWAAIDTIAERYGYSASGLAKKSGLDPTSFNPSKRNGPDGRPRWPTTESIANLLEAAGATVEEFADLLSGRKGQPPRRKHIPLLGLARAGKGGYFDGSQHVPLIVRDPKGSARGVRVETFTEAVDVMPTILERLGVAPQNHVDGHSLTEYLDGGAPAEPREEVHWEFDFREVATQRAENWFGLPSTKLSMAAIRSDKWKYVHFAGLPPLLFDLENDPGNLTNLADDPAFAGVRLEMAEKLLSWRAEHLDQTLALKQLTADGVVTAPALR